MASRYEGSDAYTPTSSRVSSGSHYDGTSHISNNSITETPAIAHQLMDRFFATATGKLGAGNDAPVQSDHRQRKRE